MKKRNVFILDSYSTFDIWQREELNLAFYDQRASVCPTFLPLLCSYFYRGMSFRDLFFYLGYQKQIVHPLCRWTFMISTLQKWLDIKVVRQIFEGKESLRFCRERWRRGLPDESEARDSLTWFFFHSRKERRWLIGTCSEEREFHFPRPNYPSRESWPRSSCFAVRFRFLMGICALEREWRRWRCNYLLRASRARQPQDLRGRKNERDPRLV